MYVFFVVWTAALNVLFSATSLISSMCVRSLSCHTWYYRSQKIQERTWDLRFSSVPGRPYCRAYVSFFLANSSIRSLNSIFFPCVSYVGVLFDLDPQASLKVRQLGEELVEDVRGVFCLLEKMACFTAWFWFLFTFVKLAFLATCFAFLGFVWGLLFELCVHVLENRDDASVVFTNELEFSGP